MPRVREVRLKDHWTAEDMSTNRSQNVEALLGYTRGLLYMQKLVQNVKGIKSLLCNVLLLRECSKAPVLGVTTTLKE